MNKILILLALSGLMFSCSERQNTINEQPISEEYIDSNIKEEISLETLKDIFENRSDYGYLDEMLKKKSLKRNSSIIYILSEAASVKDSELRIQITDAGDYSNIMLSTADKNLWLKIISEVSDSTKGEIFHDDTSDQAMRYINKTYTYETYEPKYIDVSAHKLYQFIILKSK